MYLKLKGKMPSRTEIVQLADTWPVKAFEPLVRCVIMYVCVHASLTFLYHDNRIGRSVTMLFSSQMMNMQKLVTPNLGFFCSQ